MIQRIQTVYLALAAIVSILLFFFPLASFYNEMEGNYRLFIYTVQSLDPTPKLQFGSMFTLPMVFFTVISVFFSVTTIFLYKNRPQQSRLCSFNILANVLMVMILFFFYISRIESMTHTDARYHWIGMVLPLITLMLLILANRGIRKDEALVKSADRLR